MNYVQVLSPNLNVTELAGWCLRYTERSFNVPQIYPTAWDAWEATQFRHQDKNFPEGVSVPVWFDWTGNIGSGQSEYGHSAFRTPDGIIHSAPGSGQGSARFASVDALARYFGNGMTYVGWSEDIAGVKVIKEAEMQSGVVLNQDEAEMLYRTATHQEPPTSWYQSAISQPWTIVMGKLQQSALWAQQDALIAAGANGGNAQAKIAQIKAIVESN